MENKEEILKNLISEDLELQAAAIKEIKENGDLTLADCLLDLLKKQKEPRLVTLLTNLIADIKENAFRDILIRRLSETKDVIWKSRLLRVIWESALDYSAHLDLFLKILREDDFVAAFEASTVIENLAHSLSEEQQRQLKEVLSLPDLSEEKKFLFQNILEELENTEH